MALQRQNFTLQMGQGVDTKTDPKQVIAGKLIELENATFQSTNRLTKRPGNVELAASSGLTSGNAIAPFQDQLTVMDGSSIYSYGEQFDNLVNKGTKIAVDMTVDSVIKNSYQQTAPDSALLNGLSCFAWQDSQGGVRYSVFDVATKQLILSNVGLASTTYNPKVVNVGNLFCILYVDGSTLKALSINSLNPTASPTVSTIVSLGSNTTYDAVEAQDGLGAYTAVYVAYSNASNNLAWTKFNSSFVVTTPLTYAETPVRMSIILNNPSPTAVRIAYSTTSAIKTIHSDAALSTQTGPYTIETIAGVTNIAAIFTASNTVKYFYEISSPAIDNTFPDNYVRVNTVVGTTPGTPADFNRSVCLWSKPFTYGGDVYICLVHDSKLQATYYVFNSAGRVVAKIAPDNGGGQSYTGQLREVNQLSANSYQFTYLIKDLVESLNGDVYTQTGVNSVNLLFQTPLITETLGNNLNITGGVVSAYDGQNIVEQNFHLYPENLSTSIVGDGGVLGNAQYQYSATYEWTDSQGQLHISNTAVPLTVDFSNQVRFYVGSTANSSITDPPYALTGYNPDNSTYLGTGDMITGGGLVPGDYVADSLLYPQYTYNSGGSASVVATAWSLNNQTASNTNENITITGSKKTRYSSTINSKTISVDPVFFNSYQCTFENNSTYSITTSAGTFSCYRFSTNNTSKIKPGMTVVVAIYTGYTSYFTVRSIVGNYVYMSVILGIGSALPPTISSITHVAITKLVTIQYPSPTTTNTITFTRDSDDQTNYFIGQRVVSFSFQYGLAYGIYNKYSTITNISYPSPTQVQLTFARPFNGLATPVYNIFYFSYTPHWLRVGQQLQLTTGYSSIIKTTTVNEDYTVVLDQIANATGTGFAVTDQINTAQVKVPTLRITDKPDSSPVSIAVYRTLANENLFYRVSSFTAPLLNDKTVDYLYFNDGVSDANLIGNEQLYTTGGVLSNSAPPALHVMTQYKNRLVGISSEDPLTWWFSKPVGTGIPVQFSQAFYKKIPELGGAVTALGRLDDKLVFFKRSSVFIIVGAGPNNLGLQDDFNDPELVTTDTGCTEPKSVVRMPMGLMYKSTKGIYLLNRGLNVQYIGAPVEAYNNDAITSAQLIENVNQVRFTLATGKTLVYDYFFDQWSVFTNQNAIDSTLFETKTTYLTPGGRIYKEAANVWTDAGSPIYLRLKTAWLSMNGLQGFERIYNAMVLGEYKSPHTLTFQVAHEFDPAASQTTAIPSLTSPGVYQYKVYMTRQKTDAMQFTLQESQTGPTYGEGLNISAITIEAGVKSGTNKLPASKLYG